MAVRNFWLSGCIDGRKTELQGGPASKKGGMQLTIKQRHEGSIVTAFKLYCYEVDGELITEVIDCHGICVATAETRR